MSQYNIKIQLAIFRGDDEADEKVWGLMSEMVRSVGDSRIQLNFITLQKDGKDYPRSREAMEYRDKCEEEARIEKIKDEIRSKEFEIRELRKKL